MTLVAAWLRQVGEYPELVVASDSRLTGGFNWDCGPKLFPLSRGDCVLACSGDTHWSFVIASQISRWCDEYPKARSRALDLTDLVGTMKLVIRDLLGRIRDRPRGSKSAAMEYSLLVAGYSWKFQRFMTWRSVYNQGTGLASLSGGGDIRQASLATVFMGDRASAAKGELKRKYAPSHRMDWEPLSILQERARPDRTSSVGGPLQVVKVHRHMNVMPYGVLWNDPETSARHVTLLGRPLLPFEKTPRLVIDPDTLKTYETWNYHPELVERADLSGLDVQIPEPQA